MIAAGVFIPIEVLWLFIGAALARPYILIGQRLHGQAERWWWLGGLIVAAAVYVVFTLARSAPVIATAFEVGGVVVYAALGWWGVRDRRWIAIAWLLHPVWDWLHRPSGFALAPEWYVWTCLAFDVVVGAWLLANATRRQA